MKEMNEIDMTPETQRPPYLRPQAAGILPPRRELQVARRGSAAPHTPYHIPEGVRRVVVLSNITRGFPAFELRAGDLVLHCNLAAHREEAMAVPGTHHWLFVRQGKSAGTRGKIWFTPDSFTGFERVVFIDDAKLEAYKWRAEWRQYSGRKSPSTGFLVANIVRESAPELPLILVGFDPAADHGTCRWRGHNWEAEAAWYAQRGFCLVRPTPPGQAARVLVLVCSCRRYHRRGHAAGDEAFCANKRQLCRDTWMRHVPQGMRVAFFVGHVDADWTGENDVWQLDTPDDYAHLPQKLLAAFRKALQDPEWDYIFKCDDDTFLRPDRLHSLLAGAPAAVAHFPFKGRPLSGGAGFMLRRDTVEIITRHPDAFPPTGADDHAVHYLLQRLGIPVQKSNLLAYDSRFGQPGADNAQISVAQNTPETMQELYKKNYA